jgi:hypothetical protein
LKLSDTAPDSTAVLRDGAPLHQSLMSSCPYLEWLLLCCVLTVTTIGLNTGLPAACCLLHYPQVAPKLSLQLLLCRCWHPLPPDWTEHQAAALPCYLLSSPGWPRAGGMWLRL